MEWFGLEGTLKIIWFQPPCHEQGHLLLDIPFAGGTDDMQEPQISHVPSTSFISDPCLSLFFQPVSPKLIAFSRGNLCPPRSSSEPGQDLEDGTFPLLDRRGTEVWCWREGSVGAQRFLSREISRLRWKMKSARQGLKALGKILIINCSPLIARS